jgi:hypothetical protein
MSGYLGIGNHFPGGIMGPRKSDAVRVLLLCRSILVPFRGCGILCGTGKSDRCRMGRKLLPATAERGDGMDARAIAETILLLMIAATAGALVPDLLRHIKVRQAKYGRRATDL